MKKILALTALVAMGAIATYAQGLVSIAQSTAIVSTNGPTIGQITGTGAYAFELLYSTDLTLTSAANAINGSPSTLALWTDSTVTGINGTGLNHGKITASASAAATGWTAPGLTYDNQRSVIVVGWSTAQYGSTWAGLVSQLTQAGGLAAGGYFGVTTVGQMAAGGGSGSLPAVNAWSVLPTAFTLNQVTATPEPATIALAGLGGLSLLALRRKK